MYVSTKRKYGIIMLVLQLITFGLSALIFAFIYNKLYIGGLLDEGFTSDDPENMLTALEGKVGRVITRSPK